MAERKKDSTDARKAVVEHSRLAGSTSPESQPELDNDEREDIEQLTSNAPVGTTTTDAVPGGILDPNNRTIVRPSPDASVAQSDRATAARDQELATDGSREAEAELGTGAAPEDLHRKG